MFDFLKKKTEESDKPKSNGFFSRLYEGLQRTRRQLTEGIANTILGHKTIDQALLDDIEMQLLTADLGVDAVRQIIEDLTQRLARKTLKDPEAVMAALREDCLNILAPVEKPLVIASDQKPFVILMVGINGSGKTTTIGKLAKSLQQQGLSVLLAAGDTFRAAAVEQLAVWGERNAIPVIQQKSGADSAAVIFDAMHAAKARGTDVVIADTAGRLHTQTHLMAELQKVVRVIKKVDPNAPHEVMLVLDASLGQNALIQAKQFSESVGVSGITLTKLDGTAKGGIIFAIAKKLKLPMRFIGVGEKIEDLRVFNAKEFVDALFE